MPDDPADNGLRVVRQATRNAHHRLESSVDLDSWDGAQHRWWMGRLLGLHEPVEAELDCWWRREEIRAAAPAWPPRRRSALLADDLRALGSSCEDLQALPRSPTGPAPVDRAEVLGQLYVLDGSALGGVVIATRAIANGVPAQACRSLLRRTETGRFWRETRALIAALSPAEADRAAAAAVELFERFETWLAVPRPEQLRAACA
jgi:heme oxygenase